MLLVCASECVGLVPDAVSPGQEYRISEVTMTAKPDGAAALTLASELERTTGLSAAKCYQCGKCSAGCPMAEEMRYGPHQLIRLVQMNKADKLFDDNSLWLCATCETCTARCPNNCDPARLIDGLREISFLRPHGAGSQRIRAFNDAFLTQVRAFGRLFEMGLILTYKLKTGALFDDVLSAPGMFLRGKLKLIPKTIRGVDHVRRIFDACVQEVDT